MIPDNTCPRCGKTFIVPCENIYKLYFGNSLKHFCSYTCYMAEKREREAKKASK